MAGGAGTSVQPLVLQPEEPLLVDELVEEDVELDVDDEVELELLDEVLDEPDDPLDVLLL